MAIDYKNIFKIGNWVENFEFVIIMKVGADGVYLLDIWRIS